MAERTVVIACVAEGLEHGGGLWCRGPVQFHAHNAAVQRELACEGFSSGRVRAGYVGAVGSCRRGGRRTEPCLSGGDLRLGGVGTEDRQLQYDGQDNCHGSCTHGKGVITFASLALFLPQGTLGFHLPDAPFRFAVIPRSCCQESS
ncbi:hypothetical protein D3C73_1142280 [compost metagenome]